ncbi:tyrosine-type recombinase/integrase [Azospirillum sp. sgz301742]
MYMERRRRRWYALHDIPADVQEALGRKRFVQSLETEDRAEAKRRASPLEVRWLSEIRKARTQSTDHIEQDASYWRKVLRDTPESERDMVVSLIADEADNRWQKVATRAGIVDEDNPDVEEMPEYDEAIRFFKVATGQITRFDEHIEEYLATLKNEAKTIDMKRSTLKKFAEAFPYLQDVQRKAVQRWVNKQGQEGKAVATIRRSLSELRGYWAYLTSIEAASENALPFEKLSMPKAAKPKNGNGDRKPFTPAEVVKLLHAAQESKDHEVADLIRLGMWTGARVEELCALKLTKVGDGFIEIEEAKTAAGWRQVPIHPRLQPTIDRLKKASKDSYLLSGLSPNKYGDRSNAVGKRFGRLKKELGFTEAHVFHSIRKTVATLLENAGVPENVSADILGHDKPTMTYGLYSGGASLEVKRKALEKIDYPGA